MPRSACDNAGMTEEEFLRRIDGHLEVSKEHMARGNEALAELRQSMEDMRVELRQTSLRGQRVAERFDATVRFIHADIIKDRAKDREALDDLLQEGRAGRAALFRILDELKGGSGPAAAGA
jgi:hypothetical protein